MDTVAILIFSLCAIPVAVGWAVRRKRIAAGQRCWNCGFDLRTLPANHARRRCPKCGHELERADHDDSTEANEESGDDEPFRAEHLL